jgi:hypothetical protein
MSRYRYRGANLFAFAEGVLDPFISCQLRTLLGYGPPPLLLGLIEVEFTYLYKVGLRCRVSTLVKGVGNLVRGGISSSHGLETMGT